jgi:[ribosomal protein S5]-alanine N-acetyltransferase
MNKVLETERLVLRRLGPSDEDAAFILELVNDPDWLRYIGEKGVKTIEDARVYIENGPVKMYRDFGFGLYRVELKTSREPIGICGLIKRDTLPDVDLGFAFLPKFRGQGFAFQAASAVMDYGREKFGLTRLAAIASPDNDVSARLLTKLGFKFEKKTKLPSNTAEVSVYLAESWELGTGS